MIDPSKRIVLTSALFAGLCVGQPSRALELGILIHPDAAVDARAEWNWAIRGTGVEFSSLGESSTRSLSSRTSLVVLESLCLTQEQFSQIESWVSDGGVLIVAGLTCRNSVGELRVARGRARLSGLRLEARDPGLAEVYPRVTKETPFLAPFATNDGIRLGKRGIARLQLLQNDSASVLARGYRIEPGADSWVRPSDAVTVASQSHGFGRVVFLNFSPAEIAACYPDERGTATDCSGAGTARGLMRLLVANLLWEVRSEQIPLPWEAPGDQALGVILTGDVHVSPEAYQIRSARLMAEQLALREVPLTYFIVGGVANESPAHIEALRQLEGAHLGSHSAFGEKYDPHTLSGARRILDDIRAGESMLGIEQYGEGRQWRTGFRSHGWASNETEGAAWTAMKDAGISVVFDHNADSVLADTAVSAPVEWFQGDVKRRLFLPLLERSVHTESDDFVLSDQLTGSIFSIGSPEPDPCCNWSVTFDSYIEYVQEWHQSLLRVGQMGGATEVWLWHPSTPVWKGGLTGLKGFVSRLVSNPQVEMFSAHEYATWAFNRERVTLSPRWNTSGHLQELEARYDTASLAPLPPGSKRASGEVSYWVLGDADIDGWRTTRATGPKGRTLTILSMTLVETE